VAIETDDRKSILDRHSQFTIEIASSDRLIGSGIRRPAIEVSVSLVNREARSRQKRQTNTEADRICPTISDAAFRPPNLSFPLTRESIDSFRTLDHSK
jgi:hypothetical protein